MTITKKAQEEMKTKDKEDRATYVARVKEYRIKRGKLKEKLKAQTPPLTLTDFWIEHIFGVVDGGSYPNFSNIMRGLTGTPRPDIMKIVDKYLEEN